MSWGGPEPAVLEAWAPRRTLVRTCFWLVSTEAGMGQAQGPCLAEGMYFLVFPLRLQPSCTVAFDGLRAGKSTPSPWPGSGLASGTPAQSLEHL